MGKRLISFLIGMIFGWMVLAGGVFLAAALIKPSSLGIETEYTSDDGRKFDDIPLLDIISDSIKLVKEENLTMNSIKSSFGLDIIDLLGLDSQNSEFDELKNINFADSNGLAATLSGIKLSALAPLLNDSITPDIVSAWENNPTPPTVSDLTNFNIANILEGVTLQDVAPGIKTTGIEGVVSTKNLGVAITKLNNGEDALAYLIDGARIGDAMEYTYDETTDTWMDNGEPVSDTLSNIVADIEIVEIMDGTLSVNTMFDGVKVGEFMGYDFDENSGKWFHNNEEIKDKLSLAIAKIDASTLTSGNLNINTIVEGLKVGDILGYKYNEATDSWSTKDGTEISDALTKKFVNFNMVDLIDGNFSIDDLATGLKIGDVMGYTYDQTSGKWFDGDKEITDKLTSNFADQDIQNLINNGLDMTSLVSNMKVGELMGYSYDTTKNAWYKGGSRITNVLTIKFIEQNASSFANGTLDINAIAQDIKMGDLMGYTFDSTTSKWYDANEIEVTDRLTINIASQTLGSLSESNFKFETLVDGVTLGSLITINDSSSAIMKKLKDTEINQISQKLNELYIGDLLDFHRAEVDVNTVACQEISANIKQISSTGEYVRFDQLSGKWFKAQACVSDHTQHQDSCYDFIFFDGTETKVSAVNNIISNLSVSNIDTSTLVEKIKNIPLSEFYDSQQSGVFSLLGQENPTLAQLPTALTNAVSNATMGVLISNGIIELQCEPQLDSIYQNDLVSWRDMNITTFVDSLVQKLSDLIP